MYPFDNFDKGKYWEQEVALWLESKGYNVELYRSYDACGKEIAQIYLYLDGSSNCHPDMIVNKKSSKNGNSYIEVKFISYFYKNSFGKTSYNLLKRDREYVSIHSYQFESYLQLSRWKEMDCYIVFCMGEDKAWYTENIEKLNSIKIKVTNAYTPREYGEYYFFDKTSLKILRDLKKE